ncbi:hypothetical protein HD554DRAFT_2238911, partial [Boletus coccyginus]
MLGHGHAADKDLDAFSYRSREASEHPFGAEMDIDMPFGPDVLGTDLDLGLNFGDGLLAQQEKTPGQTRSPSWMSSPLTEPPQTPTPFELNLTPRVVQPELSKKRK